jgi:GTPase SAR1 family protein
MKSDDEIPKIKVIAVGASGVGKSSILSRFAYNKFDEFL